jgi:hypothetical protein
VAQAEVMSGVINTTTTNTVRACMVPDLTLPVLSGTTISYDAAMVAVTYAAIIDLVIFLMYSGLFSCGHILIGPNSIVPKTDKPSYAYQYDNALIAEATRLLAKFLRAVYGCCNLVVMTMLYLITITAWQMPKTDTATGGDDYFRLLTLMTCFLYTAYYSVSRQVIYRPGSVSAMVMETQTKEGTSGLVERQSTEARDGGKVRKVLIQADERNQWTFFARECLMPFLSLYLLECGGVWVLGDAGVTKFDSLSNLKVFTTLFFRIGFLATYLSVTCIDIVAFLTTCSEYISVLAVGAIFQPSQLGKLRGVLEFTDEATGSTGFEKSLRAANYSLAPVSLGTSRLSVEKQSLIRRKNGLGRAAMEAQVSSFVL